MTEVQNFTSKQLPSYPMVYFRPVRWESPAPTMRIGLVTLEGYRIRSVCNTFFRVLDFSGPSQFGLNLK